MAKPDDEAQNETNVEHQDTSINPENEVKGLKLLLIHISVCICTFLVGLDTNFIATAIPVITSEFGTIKDIGWYGAAFNLTLCATQPLAGKTYTLFSKKLAYLSYFLIFELGCLVCALAPSSRVLILGRAIAGLGASGMFAGGLTILTTMIPIHKRAIWTGTQLSTFAISSVVGPIISGTIVEHLTWRWCFWINLPIGGFAALLFSVLVHIKAAETQKVPLKQKLKSLDGAGFVLYTAALTMLLLSLQWGGVQYSWHSSIVIGLLVGFVATMVVFVIWQLRQDDEALIPPRLFKAHRNVWLLCASTFFLNGPFQTVIYWLPIWFQVVLGVSPERSGIFYLPTVIADAVTAVLGGAAVMVVGYWNPFLLSGNALLCIAGGLLSTLYPGISSAHWIGYQIIGGVGHSLAISLSHMGMQSSLPPDLVPLGSAILLAFITTSATVFLAIGQLVFQESLQRILSEEVSPEVTQLVLSTGASSLRSVINDSDQTFVIAAYGGAITRVFYLTAASPAISFFLVAACKWIGIKKRDTKDGSSTEKE